MESNIFSEILKNYGSCDHQILKYQVCLRSAKSCLKIQCSTFLTGKLWPLLKLKKNNIGANFFAVGLRRARISPTMNTVPTRVGKNRIFFKKIQINDFF